MRFLEPTSSRSTEPASNFQFSIWDSGKPDWVVQAPLLLSILYMRFLRRHSNWSALYVGFQFSIWDSHVGYVSYCDSRESLSILYMRFKGNVQKCRLESRLAFNSLYEIHIDWDSPSNLHLRLFQFSIWDSLSLFTPPRISLTSFNSLYEIPLCLRSWIYPRWLMSFNSLYEIQLCDYHGLRKW